MPDSIRSGWNRISDPAVFLPLIGLLAGLIGVYISQVLNTNKNAQDIMNNQASVSQQIGDIRATITDMKSNLLPKRMQQAEDNLSNMQQSYAAQFASMQSAIQATQASQATANTALAASLHELTSQLTAQGTTIATMGVQMQYLLSSPPDGKKPK